MFLDGGLRYLKLNAATGTLLSEEVMDDRDPTSGEELDANIRWPNLPVALPDILSVRWRQYLYALAGVRHAGYQLFGMKKTPTTVPAPKPESVHVAKTPLKDWVQYTWTRELPCLARGLVLAGDKLFVAGPPRILDERKSFISPQAPDIRQAAAEQEAAWAGEKGGFLLSVDPKDGNLLSGCSLDVAPTWDGLIAAQGRLFLSTLDGSVVCLGE